MNIRITAAPLLSLFFLSNLVASKHDDETCGTIAELGTPNLDAYDYSAKMVSRSFCFILCYTFLFFCKEKNTRTRKGVRKAIRIVCLIIFSVWCSNDNRKSMTASLLSNYLSSMTKPFQSLPILRFSAILPSCPRHLRPMDFLTLLSVGLTQRYRNKSRRLLESITSPLISTLVVTLRWKYLESRITIFTFTLKSPSSELAWPATRYPILPFATLDLICRRPLVDSVS